MTNGIGLTKSFRSYLAEYIRKYEPCGLFSGEYKIKLCSDGRFIGCSANGSNSITDSNEFNKKLFDYKCYLDVNKFWNEFEDIRDMNHEKWPMIIDATDLQEHIDFKKFLKKTGLYRQLILMNTND